MKTSQTVLLHEIAVVTANKVSTSMSRLKLCAHAQNGFIHINTYHCFPMAVVNKVYPFGRRIFNSSDFDVSIDLGDQFLEFNKALNVYRKK